MRKAFFFWGVVGIVIGPIAGAACSGTTTPDNDNGDVGLPGRVSGKDAAPETVTCTDLPEKVSDRPACDKCAKERCCPQIQACNESEDCKALQDCLAPCAQEDLLCILTCQESYSPGGAKLQEVGSCATNKCKTDCKSETPDADIFDAP